MRTVGRSCIGLVVMFMLSGSLSAQDTVTGGVKISFGTGTDLFPKRWYKKKVHAQAEPVSASSVPRATAVLNKAFSKYPDHFPARYITIIHVLKSLQFYGYPYGGTYSRQTLYLTLDDSNALNTDGFLEERFHHEFSSILWKENFKLLDLEKWNSFNSQGFTYGEGGTDAIRSGVASMETDPGYFAIGFINRYAMTEIEQDINVMAQNLFCGGEPFWKIVDENERIRGKALLLVRFYQALDPMFTEAYFRSLNEF